MHAVLMMPLITTWDPDTNHGGGGARLVPMNDLDERLERAALDLNVDSCNLAK